MNWARLYLVRGGLLDSSKHGVWSLTKKGYEIDLDTFDFYALFRSVQEEYRAEKKSEDVTDNTGENEDDRVEEGEGESDLLATLHGLPPSAFERLCQRLLRECDFEQVTVTGKSGDGGIDGIGVLQVNKFVSFTVLFQCKRYQGSVRAPQVRDFRGAMSGRADKGLIITTGTFTVDAMREARRDGVPPIELVSGDDLVDLFESLELGLIPRTTYDIDDSFFDEFRNERGAPVN